MVRNLSYFFDTSTLGSNTANSIQALHMCEAFSRLGIIVRLFASLDKHVTRPKLFADQGIQFPFEIVQIARVRFLKFIINSLIMLFFALKDNSDCVYTRNIYFAFLACILLRKLVVYEAHQLRFRPFYHTPLQIYILRLLCSRRSFVCVAISSRLKTELSSRGIRSDSILVCHDGYDERVRLQIYEDTFLPPNGEPYKATAMYAGSLNRSKGLHRIDYLAAQNTDVKFVLLGDQTKAAEKPLIMKLKGYANVFIAGYVEHFKVAEHLAKADILLLLPPETGLYSTVSSPLKLFEYMSSGKAILATDLPSFREILTHGLNALLVCDAEADINCQFRSLVQSRQLRSLLGQNARIEVSKYTWLNRAKNIIHYISECSGTVDEDCARK